MCETKFFICEKCGNIIGLIHNAGAPMMCCGQKMTHLVPGAAEASAEKHLPVVQIENDRVKVDVGSVSHPMEEEHSIQWVYLQTDRGGQRKCLRVGDAPTVEFSLVNEKPVTVYAYCNIHGLWKTDI